MQGTWASKVNAGTRLLAASVAVVLTATACGTTVPQSQRGQGVATAEGQGLGGVPGSAGADALGGGAPGSTGGGASGADNRSSTGAQSGPGGAGGGIPLTGRGWDAKNVYIGMTRVKDYNTAGQTFGIEGLDQGDIEAQANAVANYYNERGGLFGRKVVIQIDDHSIANLISQQEVEAQAVCTKFTQDVPVIAVINTESQFDTANLRACFAKARILLFSAILTPFDDQTLRESNGLYFPAWVPSWTKFSPVFVNRLVAQGYFSGWDTTNGAPGAAPVRVGLWISNTATSVRVTALLKASLAKAGHDPFTYAYGDFASEANNAVLQMRSNNVTHVIGDNTVFGFATAAESQHYRPRYGVNTPNATATLMEDNAPAAQNVGAMGVGVAPAMDINAQAGEITPGGKLCREIMAANGQTFAGKRLAEHNAFSSCDEIRVLAESAVSGGGFTSPAILAGLGRIGPSFPPAGTFASGLTSTYSVFTGAGLDLQYQTSCSCYRYPNTILRPF